MSTQLKTRSLAIATCWKHALGLIGSLWVLNLGSNSVNLDVPIYEMVQGLGTIVDIAMATYDDHAFENVCNDLTKFFWKPLILTKSFLPHLWISYFGLFIYFIAYWLSANLLPTCWHCLLLGYWLYSEPTEIIEVTKQQCLITLKNHVIFPPVA